MFFAAAMPEGPAPMMPIRGEVIVEAFNSDVPPKSNLIECSLF
jgi:hypothetical protein